MRLLSEKQRARQLRRAGYSYGEIRDQIPGLSKGTLNNWLKDISLSLEQRQRLIEKARIVGAHGRQIGALSNKENREQRHRLAGIEAEAVFPSLMTHPLFAVGLMLYRAEGAKTQEMFQFMNSDPQLIQLMLVWLTQVCKIDTLKIKYRLYIHSIYAHEDCESFWQNITQLPADQMRKTVYKPTPHQQKKNEGYKGCCRLDVYDIKFFWQIMKWQRLLLGEYLGSRGEMDITTDFGSVIGGSSPSGSAN